MEEILNLIKKNKKVSVNLLKDYLQKDGKYKCPICNNSFKKHGISNHIWQLHTEDGINKMKEVGKKVAKFNTGNKLSNETKSKLSLAAVNNHNGGYKKVPYIPYKLKSGKIIKLRGTYEVRFANFLDKNNIIWHYEKKLSYIDDNGVKRYTMPDFYLPEYDKYLDTKGYLTKEFEKKIYLVKQQNNIIIHLIFEKDLNNLEQGVIKLMDLWCKGST